MKARRIGLLGGSFNPAHEGHAHISREAIKRLKLDEVWWLVSPQNPLKSKQDLAPYAARLASAKALAHHPRIRVLDLEAVHGLYYTIDTLRYLIARHPRTRFVWLMGADNLAHFHRWKSYKRLANLVSIGVLDRTPYAFSGLHGRFALWRRDRRLPAAAVRLLPQRVAHWCYITIPRHTLSATYLRKTLGDKAFLRHTRR